MNKPLLRQIIATIEAEPRRLRMEAWFTKHTNQLPRCGTVACIAGWALVLHEHKPGVPFKRVRDAIQLRHSTDIDFGDFLSVGAKALGLTEAQSYRLFYLGAWPTVLFAAYNLAKTPATRASVTVRRIKHFMRTGQ